MLKRFCLYFLIGFICILSQNANSQVLHEIGVTAGPAAITTDYGERGEFSKDFFRVRTEIDYFHSYLDHYGPISYQNNPRGEMLRAMHGETNIFEFGTQLEWHFTQIREFLIFAERFSPYITVGVHAGISGWIKFRQRFYL